MPNQSKHRIFLALSQHPSSSPSSHSPPSSLSSYTWSLWISPKPAKDTTPSHTFTVVPSAHNIWHFQHDPSAQAIRTPGLVVRVMVGKLPRDVTPQHVFAVLHTGVPVPNPDAEFVENEVSWVAEALVVLQERGWVEPFDVPGVMGWAARVAAVEGGGRAMKVGGLKVNAVGNRKFP